MKKNYSIIIIFSVISILIVFWYHTHQLKKIEEEKILRENLWRMESYFKQKECTQIMIMQINGHDVKLPEDCPQN